MVIKVNFRGREQEYDEEKTYDCDYCSHTFTRLIVIKRNMGQRSCWSSQVICPNCKNFLVT